MAKKKLATQCAAKKSVKLTIKDIPQPAPLPKSITDLRDETMHDIAADAWRAASTLFQGIDIWRQWRHELNNNDDADPVLAGQLLRLCSAGIFTLCTLGAFPSIFRNVSPDDLVSLLPSQPDPTVEKARRLAQDDSLPDGRRR